MKFMFLSGKLSSKKNPIFTRLLTCRQQMSDVAINIMKHGSFGDLLCSSCRDKLLSNSPLNTFTLLLLDFRLFDQFGNYHTKYNNSDE